MNTLVDLLNMGLAQRIGWALVHFLWQGAAIAGLLWLALRLLTRRRPQVRYAVACLALLLMAAAPVATFFVVQPAGQDVRRPAQTSAATYPEDDSWGKGAPLKVPAEFREGTATLEQAKAWCRALVIGNSFGNGHVIEVEHRELVPGGEQAVVVFDPSCGGSGGRGPQLIFSRTPKGLRFLGDLSGSWRAAPPDALGRPRLVGYWRLGGGEGKASLIVLTSRGFVPVAHVDASGGDGAADEQKRTWRTLFEEPVSQKTLAATFGEDASSRTSLPDMEKEPELAATAGPVADDATESGDGQHWTSSVSAWAEPAMPYAVAVWLAGVLACSVWHVGGWVKVQRLRRGAQPLADNLNERQWQVASGRLADALGIRRAVRLLKLTGAAARDLAGPVVVGVLRPAVLIPAAVLTGLTPSQVEAVLAHELAHVRRHDYFVNLLQTLVETLLFYHPAVWWASARIRAERENCCDDLAASAVGNSHVYAAALAALAEVAIAQHPAQPAGLIGRLVPAARLGRSSADRIAPGAKTNLLSRVRRLVGMEAGPPSRWTAALAGVLILTGLVLTGVLAYGCASHRTDDPAKTKLGSDRVAKLEQDLDTFRLETGYFLPTESYRMALAVDEAALGEWKRDAVVQISKAQALKVIKHLEQTGWIARAEDMTGVATEVTVGPTMFLNLQVGHWPGAFTLHTQAWNEEHLQSLTDLRAILEDDAAKAMGVLLQRLRSHLTQWSRQTVSFDGQTAEVEIQRFDPPLRIEPVELNKTSRANPLDAVISMQSLVMLGQGQDDFRRYAQHFSDPESFMRVRRQMSVDDWFKAVRRQQDDLCVLGLIRHKEHVLVVIWMPSMEGTRGERYVNAYNMIQRDGIWYADEDNKLKDPVVRHLHETNYAVVSQPRPAAAQPAIQPSMTDEEAIEKLVEALSAKMPRDWAHAPMEDGEQTLWYWQYEHAKGIRINLLPQALLERTGLKPSGVHIWIMEPDFDGKPLPPSEWTGQPTLAPEEIALWRGRRVLLWGSTEDTWPTARADILAALKATDSHRSDHPMPADLRLDGDSIFRSSELTHDLLRNVFVVLKFSGPDTPIAVETAFTAGQGITWVPLRSSRPPEYRFRGHWGVTENGDLEIRGRYEPTVGAAELPAHLHDTDLRYAVTTATIRDAAPPYTHTVELWLQRLPSNTATQPARETEGQWSEPDANGLRSRVVVESWQADAQLPVVRVELRHKDGQDWAQNSGDVRYTGTISIARNGPSDQVPIGRWPVDLTFNTHVPKGKTLVLCRIDLAKTPLALSRFQGPPEMPAILGTYQIDFMPTPPTLEQAARGQVSLPASSLVYTHLAATQPARRDVSIVNWIELVDKDDLPAGMFCRVPSYARALGSGDRLTPSAQWVYEHARTEPLKPGMLTQMELSARLGGIFTARGTLEVAEQFVQGDTITIRLRYVDEDRDIARPAFKPGDTGYVEGFDGPVEVGAEVNIPPIAVPGKERFKNVYLWGHMPTGLLPGRYTVNLELDEYDRKDGQLVPAPFDSRTRAVRRERLSCTFTVPEDGTQQQTTAQVGPADAEQLAIVRAMLGASDPDMRRRAAEALAGREKLPGTLMKELPAMAKGQNEYVKLCIAVAMAKAGQTDPWLDQVFMVAHTKHSQLGSTDEHKAHYDPLMLAVKALGDIRPVGQKAVDLLAANLIGGEQEFKERVQTREAAQGADDGFPMGDAGLPWIRMEAAKSLGRCGSAAKAAIPSLVRSALDDDEINVRLQSALAIGYIGVADEEAIEAMRKMAKVDPTSGPSPVTAAAGFALARMGKVDEGLPAVLTVLCGDDIDWRLDAVGLLGKMADKQVIERLGQLALDEKAAYEHRSAAALALGRMRGRTAQVMPILVDAAKAKGIDIKAVYEALSEQAIHDEEALPFVMQAVCREGGMGTQWNCEHIDWKAVGPKAVPFLLEAIKKPGCRDGITFALCELGTVAEPAIDELVISLDASNPDYTRRAAAQALARIGPAAKGATPKLLALLKDKDSSVAREAAAALGAVEPGSSTVIEALTAALSRQETEVRWAAARALGQAGTDALPALDALAAQLKDEHVYVRRFAAEAIGNIGPAARKASSDVSALLTDKNIEVRCAAALAVWRLTGNADPTLVTLTGDLRSKDAWDRQRAAETLGEMGALGEPAVGALIEVLGAIPPNGGSSDLGQDRQAAAIALGRIGPAARVALPALMKAQSDPEDRVRTAAARAVAAINPGISSEPLIDDLDTAFNLSPEQKARVRQWVEAGNLAQPPAAPNPAELASFLDSILEGQQKAVLRQLIESGKSPAQFAAERAAQTKALAAKLSNSDVKWDGDYFGLRPEIVGQAAKDLLVVGKPAIPALLQALQDNGKFTAAQVLLTKIVEPDFRYDTASSWNGLRVMLTADSRTVFYPEQIPSLVKQWRPGRDGLPLTDRLAEHRLMMEVSMRRLPKDWEGFGRQGGKVEPLHWQPGEGVTFRWQRKGFKPLDWKQPVSGEIRGGEVHVWIMEPGYAPNADRFAGEVPYPAAAGPAQEIATWRGRRVFFWGGGSDWPTAKADILAALMATDAPAAESQPATQPVQALWSRPVNGLRARIDAGRYLTKRLGMEVAVQFENVLDRPVSVDFGEVVMLPWKVLDADGKEVAPARYAPGKFAPSWYSIAPGQQVGKILGTSQNNRDGRLVIGLAEWQLKPGRYSIRCALALQSDAPGLPEGQTAWKGKLDVPAAEFEVIGEVSDDDLRKAAGVVKAVHFPTLLAQWEYLAKLVQPGMTVRQMYLVLPPREPVFEPGDAPSKPPTLRYPTIVSWDGNLWQMMYWLDDTHRVEASGIGTSPLPDNGAATQPVVPGEDNMILTSKPRITRLVRTATQPATAAATHPATQPAVTDDYAVDQLVALLSAKMPETLVVGPIVKGVVKAPYWESGQGLEIKLPPTQRPPGKPADLSIWLLDVKCKPEAGPSGPMSQPPAPPREFGMWRGWRVIVWPSRVEAWTAMDKDIAAALAATEAPAAETRPASDPSAPPANGPAAATQGAEAELKLEDLLKQLSETNNEVRREAALRLGRLRDRVAVGPLLKILDDRKIVSVPGPTVSYRDGGGSHHEPIKWDENALVRAAAARALGEIRAPEAIERLIAALEDSELAVRIAAADAVGEIGDEKAIPALRKLLDYPDGRDASAGAKALGRIGRRAPTQPTTATQPASVPVTNQPAMSAAETREKVRELIAGLGDSDPIKRSRAAIALGRIGEPAAEAVPHLVKLLHDKYEYQTIFISSLPPVPARAAAEALARLGKPGEQALVAAARDKDVRVRSIAVFALGEAGLDHVEILIQAMADADYGVRARAADAIGWLAIKTSWAQEKAVRDSGLAVSREEHMKNLLAAKAPLAPTVPLLVEALADKEGSVRAAAARALGELALFDNPKAGPALARLALHDKLPFVREACMPLPLMAYMYRQPEVIEVLISGLEHKDPTIRANAQAALENVTHEKGIRQDADAWRRWWKAEHARWSAATQPATQSASAPAATELSRRLEGLTIEELAEQIVVKRAFSPSEHLEIRPVFRKKFAIATPQTQAKLIKLFTDEVAKLQDGKQWETLGTLHDRHHLIQYLTDMGARIELLAILERQHDFDCCAAPAMIDGVVACGQKEDAWLLVRKIPEMRGDGGYVALHEAIQKLTGLKAEIPKAAGNTNEAFHARDLAHARVWAEKLARAGIGTPDTLYFGIDDTWDQLAVTLLKEGVLWYEMLHPSESSHGDTDAEVWKKRWRFLPAAKNEWVQIDIEQSMSQLRDLAVSPDRKHLAMLTSGEGHPVVDVFDLPGLLEKRAAKPLHTVDPYPGSVWIVGWDGGKLRVSSDMPLSRLARDENGRVLPEPATDPVDMMMDKPREYLLDVVTGKVTEAPAAEAPNPAPTTRPAESQSGPYLDEQQVEFLLKATSQPTSPTTLTAPPVTLYGGSKAYMVLEAASPATQAASEPTAQPTSEPAPRPAAEVVPVGGLQQVLERIEDFIKDKTSRPQSELTEVLVPSRTSAGLSLRPGITVIPIFPGLLSKQITRQQHEIRAATIYHIVNSESFCIAHSGGTAPQFYGPFKGNPYTLFGMHRPPATQPAQAVWPTLEQAAIAAWAFTDPDLPSELGPVIPGADQFDHAATLELMRSRGYDVYKAQADLNGDGVSEVLIANGNFVDKSGKEATFDGAQNRSWAVIQKVTDGWRIVGAGFGSPCPPRVLDEKTNGWKDFESGHHLSVASGASYLYQCDEGRYKLVKETAYDNWPTQPAIAPAPSATTRPAGALLPESIKLLKQLALDYPDWDGPLSQRLKVRVEADTWDELIAKVKPTFTWGRPEPKEMPNAGFPDMMWVEEGSDGKPIFRVARAYTWKPAGLNARWVLVDYQPDDKPMGDLLREQLAGRPMPATLPVLREKPSGDHPVSYAILEGSHPRGGQVYEIGWARDSFAGNGWWEALVPIFVWRDTAGKWRLIGEGPEDWQGKASGGICNSINCESTLLWRGEPPRPVVTFVRNDWQSEVGEDQVGLPPLTTCRDAVLDATGDSLPADLKWSDHEYIIAEKGDALEKIIYRLKCWDTTADPKRPSAELLQARKELRLELLRLNPKLAPTEADAIREGTRIVIRRDQAPTSAPASQAATAQVSLPGVSSWTGPAEFAKRGGCDMAAAVADIRGQDWAKWHTSDGPPDRLTLKSASKIGMDANDQPDVVVTIHSAGNEGPEVMRFYGIDGKTLRPQAELVTEYGTFEPLNAFKHKGREFIIIWGHFTGSAGGGPQWVLCKEGPRVRVVPYDNPVDKTRHLLATGEHAGSVYLNPGTWGTTAAKPDGLSFAYYIWGPDDATASPRARVTGTFILETNGRADALRFAFQDAHREPLDGADSSPATRDVPTTGPATAPASRPAVGAARRPNSEAGKALERAGMSGV